MRICYKTSSRKHSGQRVPPNISFKADGYAAA